MADSAQGGGQPESDGRRNFLKIGAGVAAGVAAGAAVAAVAGISYSNSVMSSESSSSSSAVASIQSQLSSSQQQLSAAQGQVSSLNQQLTTTQGQLSSANAALSNASSQLASTQQALTSANGQIATLQSQSSSAQAQLSNLQVQIDTVTGFLTLSTTEQSLLSAIALTMIPDDGNGPSATDAGVVYFIDRQLATDYGKSAHMYMEGPFVLPNQTQSISVNDRNGNVITYAGGSTLVTMESGMQYQYHNNFREFFRYGLAAFESYCNSAYGGDYETLSNSQQVQALTDLYNNKPTNFNNIMPADFFYELFVMVWSGYFMDPLYGGNKGMAAWVFSAFNGTNSGNFYGEGYTVKELMVASTPTRLMPASLGQFQKGSP